MLERTPNGQVVAAEVDPDIGESIAEFESLETEVITIPLPVGGGLVVVLIVTVHDAQTGNLAAGFGFSSDQWSSATNCSML